MKPNSIHSVLRAKYFPVINQRKELLFLQLAKLEAMKEYRELQKQEKLEKELEMDRKKYEDAR